MTTRARILLVEDDQSIAASLRRVLEQEGYAFQHRSRGDEGLQAAQEEAFDLVITDFKLPGLDGIGLVRQLHQAKPRLPILLMTAHGTAETAIEATKFGAFDYLLKPFPIPEFLDLVDRAVRSSRAMSEPVELGTSTPGHRSIIGNSRAMQTIYKEIGRIAAKPVTVLIRGETGTGKELVARAIYQHSDRSLAPFISVNCAAIPATLLESELFGHERGAFTGAAVKRLGRFEQANGGTLFLDEIGDLSLETQAKLLRVLQEREVQRLGGTESIPLDVRILAATHQDLERAIAEKRFREDLFYRLNVVTLQLPPLRERLEDVPALASYLLAKHAGPLCLEQPSILPTALERLQAHSWPGNIRELENVLRQAMLQSRGYAITADLIDRILAPEKSGLGADAELRQTVTNALQAACRGEMEGAHAHLVEKLERELFQQAITLADGNQSKAAQWLGVSRITVREKLQRFGLHPGQTEIP